MPYGRAKEIFKIIYLRKRVVRDPDPDAFELESIEWHRQMRLQEEHDMRTVLMPRAHANQQRSAEADPASSVDSECSAASQSSPTLKGVAPPACPQSPVSFPSNRRPGQSWAWEA